MLSGPPLAALHGRTLDRGESASLGLVAAAAEKQAHSTPHHADPVVRFGRPSPTTATRSRPLPNPPSLPPSSKISTAPTLSRQQSRRKTRSRAGMKRMEEETASRWSGFRVLEDCSVLCSLPCFDSYNISRLLARTGPYILKCQSSRIAKLRSSFEAEVSPAERVALLARSQSLQSLATLCQPHDAVSSQRRPSERLVLLLRPQPLALTAQIARPTRYNARHAPRTAAKRYPELPHRPLLHQTRSRDPTDCNEDGLWRNAYCAGRYERS